VAGKLMTTPAVTVPLTATVTEAARRMHTAGVKRLPVGWSASSAAPTC
jgi:CBS domain-containing protein